ncbi:MAG: hypothetical protein ABW036_07025, partial [Flavitalea sp.]
KREQKNKFSIYPNPASTFVNLVCQVRNAGSYSWILYSQEGHKINTGSLFLEEGRSHLRIGLSNTKTRNTPLILILQNKQTKERSILRVLRAEQ